MPEKTPLFKKEIDNIQIPTDKIDAIISNIELRGLTVKKSKPKKGLYFVGAAIVLVGLLLGSLAVSPTMANTLSSFPIIGSVFKMFGDSGLKNVTIMGISEQLGESKIINNKTVTIEEAYFDNTRLTISYKVESDKPIAKDYFTFGFKINGKALAGSMTNNIQNVTPRTSVGFLTMEIYESELPNATQVEVSIEGKEGELWEFLKTITKQETKINEIGYVLEKDELKITVDQITSGSGGFLLTYTSNIEEYYKHNLINFQIIDSNGKKIKMLDGSLVDGVGKILYEPFDDDVTELRVTPYVELLTKDNLQSKNKIMFDAFTLKINDLHK